MIGDLNSLRMFVAAYEEGTFTAAALRENSTQSGVSQRVSQLESRLRTKLFLRMKTGVVPTPAADGFYRRCVELLRAHHDAMRFARTFGSGLTGTVTLGLMPSLAQSCLAPTLLNFDAAHANVRVLIVEAYGAQLVESLRAGSLDLAVMPSMERSSGLRLEHFARVPEVLVSSRNSPLPAEGPVALSDCGPVKLIVPSSGNIRRRNIETYCAAQGVKIERLLTLDSLAGSLHVVASSDWLTILPLMSVLGPGRRDRIKVSPLADPGLDLDIASVSLSRKSLSEAAQVLRSMLAETVAEVSHRWQTCYQRAHAAPATLRSADHFGLTEAS